MTSILLSISAMLADLFSLVLLLFSLFYCFRPYNPAYMRILPIYCFGNFLANLFNRFYPDSQQIVYVLYTVFELLFFVYFMTRVIKSGRVKKLIWILTGLLIVYTTYLILKKDMKIYLANVELFECIILVTACLVYFREIFLIPKVTDLRKEPSFWMVTGILFYFFLLIPTLFFSSYFHFENMETLSEAFYSINNFAQVISFILFIKAMRCRRKVSL